MQIRADSDILAQYGSPSRPISPSALSAPNKKVTTTGNELGENENRPTESQAGCEPQSQQPPPAKYPPKIPNELIDHIVDHLHDDKESLFQCSLTSRAFSHATSYHLFRTVKLPSISKCVQFQELIRSSLHPISRASSPYPSSSTSSRTPSPSRISRPAHHHVTQAHPRSTHLHPPSDRTNTYSHALRTCTPTSDVSAAGWDISKFVRKIEFWGLEPQSRMDEYVSEAVKLVKMLPRVREVAFAWWMESAGINKIGEAFAPTIPSLGHQSIPPNQPSSSELTSAVSETRTRPAPTSDPLKIHLEGVDFESVHTFLDFLQSFGGRVRELSLSNNSFGGASGGEEDSFQGRCFPGIECVCLGYEDVIKPKGFDQGSPTMGNANVLFGVPAFDQTYDVCHILEWVAPNVSELQLTRDDADVETMFMCMPEARTERTLRVPKFRKLKSVTLCVPGPHWSDLIYEIAAWFARDELGGKIADPTCHDGSASTPTSVTPSLPSSNQTTRVDRWRDRKRTRVRFFYHVRKGDVDWRKLESAVSGEETEDLEG